MVTEVMLLTRQTGVELLIQKVPRTPYERSHSYDDEFDVEWRIGEQIVQVSLEPGENQARWLSWRKSEYPDIKNPFRYLDITKPETWSDLLSELQC